MLEEVKEKVYQANMLLPQSGLVTLTWGNSSQIDRASGLVVIKPSGVPYKQLTPEDMVVVNMDGKVIEGDLQPSSDTPTHLYLYKKWLNITGIVHTHSPWAVAFAQAGLDIPAAGTTHADTFYGDVPVAQKLSKEQVERDYELNTGKTIVSEFTKRDLNPMAIPAVLTDDHGPFTWGENVNEAVHNAIILDTVANMAYHTMMLSPGQDIHIEQYLLDRHYYRKHGEMAYYGQKNQTF